MTNYFNTNIVERHEDHMHLNNRMAECYAFLQGVAEFFDTESDVAWWHSQKKGHICYDVWHLT